MSTECWASRCACPLSSGTLYLTFCNLRKSSKISFTRDKKKSCQITSLLKVGVEDMAEIVHNKVLIAAGVSAAIGQLSKPFTSVILYGKDFDFKTAVQAGGFPSTHSSSVVAAATSLALERGFSDPIFGLTLVYAGLVMYDAQGVRREVGNHAKALNKVICKAQTYSTVPKGKDGLIGSVDMESLASFLSDESTSASDMTNSPVLVRSDRKMRQASQMVNSSGSGSDVEEVPERAVSNSGPLKESIGHTEVEVIAGALLGFFVSLAMYSIV